MFTALLPAKGNAFFVLLLGCCVPFGGLSQLAGKEFIRYDRSNGISSNSITAITQDRFGYMWIGTERGLNRFDGSSFIQYHSEKNKESLPSSEILKLKWADSNRLAVVTRHGLAIFNIRSMKQTSVEIPAGELKYADRVNATRDVLTDEEGDYYIATRTGFYHLTANGELVFRYDDYSPDHAASNAMGFGTFLGWLDEHNIIVTGQKGLYQYCTLSRKFLKIENGQSRFLVFDQMNRLGKGRYLVKQPRTGCFILLVNSADTGIYIDEKRKLVRYSHLSVAPLNKEFTWRTELFGLNDSTLCLSGKFSGLFRLCVDVQTGCLHVDTTKFYPSHNCNSLFVDKRSRLWMGTSAGLFKEDKRFAGLEWGRMPVVLTSPNPVTTVRQVAADENRVYAASTVSGGLHVFRKSDLSFLKTISFPFPPYGNGSLLTLARKGKDTILCGADTGLFWYDSKNGSTGLVALPGWKASANFISNVFEDRRKHLWIASNRGGGCYVYRNGSYAWLSFQQPLVKNFQQMNHMAEDSHGNIWMGGNGLARYSGREEAFDLFVDSFPAVRLHTKSIDALAIDGEDNIWLGNTANGLLLFEPGKKKFTSFTEEDGLPDNDIAALKITGNTLWIACKTGIAGMDVKNKKIFSVCNGRELYFHTVSSNALFYDGAAERIYAGIGPDVVRFNPAFANDIVAPRLLLESVVLGNDSVLWNPTGSVRTTWRNKNIILSFSAINYDDAPDQRYAYRMADGGKGEWIALGEQRKVVLGNLTAGEHSVEIKVFSLNNRWASRVMDFTIVVSPPFWNTGWFYLLCLAVSSSLVYVLVRYRINQLKKVMRMREKISRDLHDEVGATLSGISMYSHLTRVQMKSGQGTEVEKSLDIIQQSAADMVSKLNDIVWVVSPEHDSLRKLVQKLEEYASEMAAIKSLVLHADVDPAIVNLKLPMEKRRNIYLICKEAVNNAVKYSCATRLVLKVKAVDHSVEFWIKDNGKGFEPVTAKRGNGLSNMQKRANEMGASLVLHSKPGEGSSVFLQCKIT